MYQDDFGDFESRDESYYSGFESEDVIDMRSLNFEMPYFFRDADAYLYKMVEMMRLELPDPLGKLHYKINLPTFFRFEELPAYQCTVRTYFFLAGEASTKIITRLIGDNFHFDVGGQEVILGKKPVAYPVSRHI